jgi:C4-dicarboxylate transporter, DctQ subunit
MPATRVQRVLKAADRLEEAFMIVALIFMTGLTVVQVVLRYGFSESLVWSLEATMYTFAWLVLIGMSYGVRTEAHIAVDLVTSRLSRGGARVFAGIALACGLAYCALMIYGSSQFVELSMTLGNNARDIPLRRWILTGIMPIAFGLLALRLVQAAHPVLRQRSKADDAR